MPKQNTCVKYHKLNKITTNVMTTPKNIISYHNMSYQKNICVKYHKLYNIIIIVMTTPKIKVFLPQRVVPKVIDQNIS